MKRIVVCMKWGTLFNATYVNVLFNAVKAHCPSLDEFICITEDATGIHPAVKIQSIPDMPIDASYYAAGAWPKLVLFKRGVFPANSRVLFIDLDMMICGDLDRLFALPRGFYAIGDPTWSATPKTARPNWYKAYKTFRSHRKEEKARKIRESLGLASGLTPSSTMGSGIFAFDADTLTCVYHEFEKSPTTARALYQNEQHFLEHHCGSWSPWPPGLVIHFKYSLRQPLVIDWFRHPKPPPIDCSAVSFSGRPRPDELANSVVSSLKEFPHGRLGRVRWFQDYWIKFSVSS